MLPAPLNTGHAPLQGAPRTAQQGTCPSPKARPVPPEKGLKHFCRIASRTARTQELCLSTARPVTHSQELWHIWKSLPVPHLQGTCASPRRAPYRTNTGTVPPKACPVPHNQELWRVWKALPVPHNQDLLCRVSKANPQIPHNQEIRASPRRAPYRKTRSSGASQKRSPYRTNRAPRPVVLSVAYSARRAPILMPAPKEWPAPGRL